MLHQLSPLHLHPVSSDWAYEADEGHNNCQPGTAWLCIITLISLDLLDNRAVPCIDDETSWVGLRRNTLGVQQIIDPQ